VEREGEAVSVVTEGGVRLPAAPSKVAEGTIVYLGIRPEDFRLSDDGLGIPFRVDVIEPTGAETHLYGTIDGAEARCVFRDRIEVAPGEVLKLHVDPADTHLFDRETGRRL
jgi:multiple sugar transport system ATP-binding protein